MPTDPRRDLSHGQALEERIKELKCLYGAFKLLTRLDAPLDNTLQAVVDLMPGGWQYPESACARLILGDQEYRSASYRPSDWKLSAGIMVNREAVGTVEIAYLDRHPECSRGPFLEKEVFLLEALASLVGQILQRKALEDEKTRLHQDLQRNYEKILSGFIPICASCKNIRDKEGVWHPIETYVQKRTEARFSHGICPACLAKLYPQMDDKSSA
jgi:hypothetical protein